ncbi:OmpA family protein [Mucilaginibacter sp. AW1-3]
MKRNLFRLSLVLSLLVLSQPVKAQNILKQANEQYNLFNYTRAIELYLQAYKKTQTFEIAEHLANSYRLTNDYKDAETWYGTATTMPEARSEDFLHYAQVLQTNSKYAEAKEQYTKYYAVSPDITQKQLKLLIAACDSSIAWKKDPRPFEIVNEAGLNGPKSDWGATRYNNTVIFTSDRINKAAENVTKSKAFLRFDVDPPIDRNRYLWTGNDYLHLYQAPVGVAADAAKPFGFTKDGTDYHMGAASFTADGNEMYFTLTRIPKKQPKDTSAIKTIRLEIYWSRKEAATGEWSKPLPFTYNNENWSTGDPYITPDGKTLYFASDMPGGKGGTDIYYSVKNTTNNWEAPVNITAVNTTGNERTPFLYRGNLYFSSDGGVGMGGLDVYKALLKNTTYGPPTNMAYPVNSPYDDFAYMLTTDSTGYLASNRPGGAGSDDIYSFTQKPPPTFLFEGTVYDVKTKQVIANSTVRLTKSDGKVVEGLSGADGKFSFRLDEKSNYKLHGEKKSYLSDNQTLTTVRANPAVPIRKDLYLDKIELNKTIRLENIYYDLDESYIRDDAAAELDKLIKILKENPTIEIELASHTDSRGSDAYNMELSQARADAAVQYIVDIGDINPKRIKAKGYGKTRLLNKCKNGVNCTEAEHQLNRRTEFKIIHL